MCVCVTKACDTRSRRAGPHVVQVAQVEQQRSLLVAELDDQAGLAVVVGHEPAIQQRTLRRLPRRRMVHGGDVHGTFVRWGKRLQPRQGQRRRPP
jgi:hypothetical protein